MILALVEPSVKVRAQDEPVRPLGSTVTLLCESSGNPPPTLSWSKEGQLIMSSADGVRISLIVQSIFKMILIFRVIDWISQN